MPFAPVDYGPQLQPDTQGLQELQQQRAAVFHGVHEIANVVEGGAQAIAQGMLHTQSLKATAAVKERQASSLEFIDSNPYVDKTILQQRMAPEDYSAWHARLGAEYKDADTVPMYMVAGALFDSEAKRARDEAGQIISLPGWRGRWNSTEQTESATIRERYVNRLAADQMIADQRAQTLQATDKTMDAAVKPEDFDTAAKMVETSPWLKPAERRFAMEKALVAKDSFVARQAMLGGDTEVMKAELTKLKSDKSAELFPNMNVKQRLDLEHQLTREFGFKAAKATAEGIVGPNVDENGKVNRTAISKALAAYKGLDKEDVTKAVKIEESEKLDIFDKSMSEVAKSILSAGRDPMTGRFSYAKAMQNPEARKAAYQLNKDDPDKLTPLSREDVRWDNIDAKADAAERRLAKAALIKASGENLEKIHRAIDDPTQNDVFKNMTAAQFDVQLYNRDMVEEDRGKARKAFAEFQKNGGKPDERAIASVNAEIKGASGGSVDKARQLMDQYQSKLLKSAHEFIRNNPTLPPDKMTDALRAHLKTEMMGGKVLGSGIVFDDTTRRIEWETNSKYQGKDFQLRNGTILRTGGAPVTIKGDEDFNGLPVGAHYVGPDGVERVK